MLKRVRKQLGPAAAETEAVPSSDEEQGYASNDDAASSGEDDVAALRALARQEPSTPSGSEDESDDGERKPERLVLSCDVCPSKTFHSEEDAEVHLQSERHLKRAEAARKLAAYAALPQEERERRAAKKARYKANKEARRLEKVRERRRAKAQRRKLAYLAAAKVTEKAGDEAAVSSTPRVVRTKEATTSSASSKSKRSARVVSSKKPRRIDK